MSKSIWHKIGRALGWSLFVLFLTLVALICAIYSPAFQDFALPHILNYVNSSTEMHVEAERFRLSFPLDVKIEGVTVLQKGDTLVTASEANVNVRMLPLLSGNVDVTRLDLREVYFKSGNPDSTTYLRARLKYVDLKEADIALSATSVDLDRLYLDGGRVDLSVRNDTTPPTPPTPNSWRIKANTLQLNNVDFNMAMLSTGDSIAASLSALDVKQGLVDLKSHNVDIGSVDISHLNARYLTASEPMPQADSPNYPSLDTVPWTIRLAKLRMDSAQALYSRQGYTPVAGFDPNCISLTDLAIEVDSLYNRGPAMRVPLVCLSARERCGLPLSVCGLFAMDSDSISATDFIIDTALSHLAVDATYGLGTTNAEDAPISLDLDGEVAVNDIATLMPAMQPTLAELPYGRKLELKGNVSGRLSRLNVSRLSAEMRDYFSLLLKGHVEGITDFDTANGAMTIEGNIRDVAFIEKGLAATGNALPIDIPPMTLDGDITLRRGTIHGELQATTSNGRLALDASWNGTAEAYDIDLSTTDFPVNAFMPRLGLGRVTADISAKGHGLNPLSDKTLIEARVDAINVNYNRHDIRDISIEALLSGGNATLTASSSNPTADLRLNAAGNLAGAVYDWTVDADITRLDLQALGMSDSVLDVATRLSGHALISPKQNMVDADLSIGSFDALVGSQRYSGSDIDLCLNASDTLTTARLTNRDLNILFDSPTTLDSIATRFGRAATVFSLQIDRGIADISELQQALPRFNLDIVAGTDNILATTLASSDISFDRLTLHATNDSLINITAAAERIVSGSTRLDHVTFNANQHSNVLVYKAVIDNDPGTMDDFAHAQVNGYIANDKLTAFVKQQNINGETGYKLGGLVTLSGSTVTVRLIPYNPIIGYKSWTINTDNYLAYNTSNRHIDANLLMQSAESSLSIFTEHDSIGSGQEDIVVKIDNLKIADWIAINPYATPMKGDVSADMRFALGEKSLSGKGTVAMTNFYYGKKRVGDLEASLDLSTGERGMLYALTSLKVDGQKVMSAKGVLNDSTAVSPINLDFSLERFPLTLANPFIGAETATLSGYLNGDMDITGTLDTPHFDGCISFDSATVKVATLGTTFSISDVKVPVDSNVVSFNDFEVMGVNSNPLCIDGTVNINSPSDIDIDLALKARNCQIVGNNKRRGADVYGKAFINLDAKARGNLNALTAEAKVTVLPETNVTYVMASTSSQLGMQTDNDMVRFVNFADTTQVVTDEAAAPASSMALNLAANLRIAQGSTINVDLNTDGTNKVYLKSQGNIDFNLDRFGDMRAVGRIQIDNGYVRYTPPLMSEKLFNFEENSYVAFNGDLTNPTLNLKAVDTVKANVTQEGQNSRLINFDVSVAVTGTASTMNVAFDMSTSDDVTVENELQSMSAEQRASQAMNLLLYGVYTGPGTAASSSISGNPLYSFLEGQLNSWMANNVKGVDITFGFNQYDSTVDGTSSTTTSYSYRVSKTFLNDRFKIVIGGNYSTDDNTDDNLSQNLINDVSVEYYLNRSGSMYLRLFRHTGYESILEGEVTQTGVGFVYKRKLNSLRDLFRFGPRKQQLPQQGEPLTPYATTNETPIDKKD